MAINSPRITGPTLQVLGHLISNAQDGQAGSDISKSTGLASGTLYPILARFEKCGWLLSEWEALDPVAAGRPRKRLYRLTANGLSQSKKAFSNVYSLVGGLVWQE